MDASTQIQASNKTPDPNSEISYLVFVTLR